MFVFTERLSINGKLHFHGAEQPRARKRYLICPMFESLVFAFTWRGYNLDSKALPMGLSPDPNPSKKAEIQRKAWWLQNRCPRRRHTTTWLASHRERWPIGVMTKEKRSQERRKKEILKKNGRKGNTNTLQKNGIYGGTGQEMDSICISEKSLVFTYILKDFQPVLLGEIKKEEKADQGEN